MLKIRALNEPHCSSESEDEDNPRLSKEAQESNAIALYNDALRLQQRDETQEAVEIFQRILELPYLNELENKTLSPLQTQTRLGCLKCLSSLYTNGPSKNLSLALEIFELLTELEPSNVNNWYRYGKVALEMGDFRLAFDAFQGAHSCSSGHWGCIDKLVTLSYVLHDLSSCLKYCAVGLQKDPAFVKGIVFRDYVFKMNPWIQNAIQSKRQGFESLLVVHKGMLDDSVKKQYLDEARFMLRNYTEKQILIRKQEEIERNAVVTCPYYLKSVNFIQLFKTVILFEKYLKQEGNLLSPVDFSGVLSCLASPSGEPQTECTTDNGEELSQSSGLLRSRSSSDDKEPIVSDAGNGTASGVNENDDKSAEEDSLTDPQNRAPGEGAEDESFQKKKAKKDVKWWQLEGKRRSQRVRGNLMPSSLPTNKPKSENSFAEMLKNVIPSLLFISEDSTSVRDKNSSLSPRRKSIPDASKRIYFGTPQEAVDVRKFIAECETTDISTIISKLIKLMSREFKGNWPMGLADLFLDLFNTYRTSVRCLKVVPKNCDIGNENIDKNKSKTVGDEACITLTVAELLMDSSKMTDTFNSVMYELETLCCKSIADNTEYVLRKMWMHVKHYFKLCKSELMEYSIVHQLLRDMLKILNQPPKTEVYFVPTQTDFKITVETIQEKVSFAEKMENLNKINELYEEKNYEALVDILQFSLTSGDGDLKNRYYLAESHYHLGQIQCVEQCAKVCEDGIRTLSDEILLKSLILLRKIWDNMKETLNINEYKVITNTLLQLLIYYDKQNTDQDFLITEPWCLLHSVLLYLEEKDAAFYIEEDSVPNSVLLLQLGHEVLSGNGKCCVDDGRFLSYTMDILLKLQGSEDYWGHEETKTCLDQAILCLFAHPNKKFKLKNVKDHGASGITLTWKVCSQLYQYYKLEELPEFDSYGSISVEVENLFQRIIQEMPENLSPKESYKHMMQYVEGKSDSKPEIPWDIPTDIADMYYLIADFYLKTQVLQKAVEFYTWDLAVRPFRFDSWAAIALSKAEEIYTKLNSCDRFCVEDLTSAAQAVVICFQTALDLDETNSKVRIEFGSFLYSLHSIYSRELKFHTHQFSLDMFEMIEKKKNEYLLEAEKWFEPHSKNINEIGKDGETQNEEVWMNHYMLGKVKEKLHPNSPEVFLKEYELAGKLLHAEDAPYPAKINYYNAPENALEALEIYYRTHASILSYVERTEYSEITEELLMSFLQRAEASPFVKSKQGRGGENSESKKKKNGDDTASKKDLAEISDLINELVGNVEDLVAKIDSESSNDSYSANASTEEDSSDESPSGELSSKSPTAMSSFSLSAFKDKLREKELRQVQLAEETSKIVKSDVTSKPTPEKKPEVQLDSLQDGPFHPDFVGVKYGKVVSHCLKAMKECIARYPQSFKAYYRLAYCYKVFKKDLKKAREYLLGNNGTGANKISGLYGERKQNNFFNGIWRNPSDDIDRAGSFSFHMAKSIQLLLTISQKLYDHQLLAEMGIQLAKVPDSHNAYLFTEDREQFSKEAIKSCVTTAKKSVPSDSSKLLECGKRIYDTYTKFQKHSPRENGIAPVLLDLYKQYAKSQFPMIDTNAISLNDTVKFFQHLAWTNKATSAAQKPSSNGVKQGENSRRQVSDDTTATASSQNEESKRTTSRKITSQRRVSDREPGSANDQTKSKNPATITTGPASNPLPLLVPTFNCDGDFTDNLRVYANQLNTYYATLSSMSEEAVRTSQQLQSQSQLGKPTTSQASNNLNNNNKSKQVLTPAKRDKFQTSNVPNLIGFSQPETLPSVNQLISNVSKAIAASFASNSSTEKKKTTVQPRAKEKPSPVDSKNSLTHHSNNKVSSSAIPTGCLPNQSKPKRVTENNLKRKWPQAQITLSQQAATDPLKQMSEDSYIKNTPNLTSRPHSGTSVKPKVVNNNQAKLSMVQRSTNVTKSLQNCKSSYQGVGSRLIISTSPFQAQNMCRNKPSISDFSPESRAENALSTRIPPAAHYQANITPRPSPSGGNEPEVVDLTTKSPDKAQPVDNTGMPAKFFKQRPIKRTISSVTAEKERHYPLPPKKKHHIMPRSPIMMADPLGPDPEEGVEVRTSQESQLF